MYNYVGWLIAVSLNVPAHRLNIVPVIAGGSFGSKLFAHKVPVLTATLARAAGRPVKFIEDRIDNITSCDNHGSDRVYDMEVAVMNDGTITSLRMKVIDDYGAYLQFGVGHHGNAAAQLTGPYRIGSGEIDLTAVLTNKCQQAPTEVSGPRSPTSCWSAWSMPPPTSWAWIRRTSGARTSSSPTSYSR